MSQEEFGPPEAERFLSYIHNDPDLVTESVILTWLSALPGLLCSGTAC